MIDDLYQEGWDEAMRLVERLSPFIGLFWSFRMLEEPSRALAKEAAVSRGWRVCAVGKGHLWNVETSAHGLYRAPKSWDKVPWEPCVNHAKRGSR